jgi:hypothetical protein
MGPFYVFLLLILISSLFWDPQTSNCDLCIHTTWAGSVVGRTYYSCAGNVIGSCTHNCTIYSVCSHGNQRICFNPTYRPKEQWLKVHRFDGSIWGAVRDLINLTQVFNSDKPVSVFFDVYVSIGQDSRGYGGLAWERAYMSNDKYKCQGGWLCEDVGWHCCPYWSCVSWAI